MLICGFRGLGEPGVTSRKKFQNFEKNFFGRLGPHRTPPPARVRHERPPFSTNSFTDVVILDSQTLMGPKGKRNRRGVLLSLLHCLPQPPDTPRTPPGPARGFFLAEIFISCAGGLFHRPKLGESTLKPARLGSSNSLSPQAASGATKHPQYPMSATVLCWKFVTGRALILAEGRKQTKRNLEPRGLACPAAAVPAKHALPPTAPPPAYLQFDPAGRCRSELTSQIVRGAPPRYRARSQSRPRGY